MLAPNEKTNLYLEFCKEIPGYEAHVRLADERAGPFSAQLASTSGSWCGLMTAPAHECIAASHLTARGYGIYLPETEATEIRRGRKVDVRRLLVPGYLFVYVWGIGENHVRVRSCPGVVDFLRVDGGHIRVIPWTVIDELREIENLERPVSLPMSDVVQPKKKKKGRWRKSRREDEVTQEPEPILCVHAYSPFIEEMRKAGLDDEARISAFNKRLGLGS